MVDAGSNRDAAGCSAELAEVESDDEQHLIEDGSRRERCRKAEKGVVILLAFSRTEDWRELQSCLAYIINVVGVFCLGAIVP